MIALVRLLPAILASPFRSKTRLEAENAALRQQLIVLRRKLRGRIRLTNSERIFFVWLVRQFPSALGAILIVQPETSPRWPRAGFRRCWRWKSRVRRGRPPVEGELRSLIRRMSRENPLWEAPRIHGELLKLGFEVVQSTVAKYMVKLALARDLGAHETIIADRENVVKRVMELTGNRGADIAVDLTPVATQPIVDAVDAVRVGGTIVSAGIKGGSATVPLDTDRVVVKELTVQGVFTQAGAACEQAIWLLSRDSAKFTRMHTHDFPLHRAARRSRPWPVNAQAARQSASRSRRRRADAQQRCANEDGAALAAPLQRDPAKVTRGTT